MIRHKLKFNLGSDNNILIIDGKYLVYRNQYSKNVSELNYNGFKTGMYYGFFNTIRSLITKFNPVNLVIMWDGVGSIRRNEYDGYKKRTNLKYLKQEQIDILNEIRDEYPLLITNCELIGFAGYSLDGYEADDLIALFVNKFTDINKIIITRDEDIYQCLDKHTIIYDPDSKLKKDVNWFRRTYQIEPNQWALVKAYAGCKSDTVPGIDGVGEKTAIKIIQNDPKAIEKLKNANPNEIKLWQRLTVLPHPNLKDVNMPYKITHIKMDTFIDFCQQLNFRSLIEKIYDFNQLI